MQTSSPQKFAVIGFVPGLLFFCSFIGYVIAGYVSVPGAIYHVLQFIWVFFLGLQYLYTGTKKLRQRKAKQEQVHWYNQPEILIGVSALLALPPYLLDALASKAILDTISIPAIVLLFTPSILCLLAAAFFAIRRLLGYQRSKV